MPDKNIQKRTFLNVRLDFLVCMFLVVAVLAAYWQIPSCGFVGFDDKPYVTENRQVQKGFTVEGLAWAFTTFHAANWHPLTWLSHMLDCQLYGLNPLGHHWTNLLLHIGNTLLLFFILQQMTGALWQSAFVAALFALHPLHVESVAWVAERKDVLSTFFGILAIIAYYRYVKQKSVVNYLFVFFFLCLGLMAKPMLVTWPFLLLLLDFWPLNRLHFSRSGTRQVESITGFDSKIFFKLILEKIPLFIPVIFSSIITFMAQQSRGAVDSLTSLPLDIRINNALVSWVSYVIKAVWPAHLIVFYPHPGNMLPIWQGVGAALLIAGSTCAAVRLSRQYPYGIVGLFWYLGTLVPVIGLVKVGIHGMADRYTYVPLVGLFIMISWGASDLLGRWRHGRVALAAGACAIVLALVVCSRFQVSHWKNTTFLFKQALAVTTNNYVAHYNLGVNLERQGRLEEAISHLNGALRIRPNYAQGHYSLGNMLGRQGRLEEAVNHFSAALHIRPNYAEAHYSLGVAMERLGREEEALEHYRKVLKIRPDHAGSHNNLGAALARRGSLKEAVVHFTEALGARSGYAEAHNNLGLVLARLGRVEDAMRHYREALQINPHYAEAHNNLGSLLAANGRLKEAVRHFSEALRIKPGHRGARHNLELGLR